MRINFVLPFIQKSGGILVVLEHARQLRAKGHDVRVYYPLRPYLELLHDEKSPFRKYFLGQLKPFLGNLLRWRTRAPWFPHHVPVTPVFRIAPPFLRPADVTVATAWVTAYDVDRLDARFGRKIHFIQGYEQWNADPALVDGAYRLPMEKITISPWLTALLKEKFGRMAMAEVPNGVDILQFSPPEARPARPLRVLMIYHEQEVKGTPDGLAVLDRIHRRFPDVAITLFGPTPFRNCPPYAEFHLAPPVDKIAELYRSAHVFLFTSRSEGWGLPPMEAMACGCAVVATAVGCVPILHDGTNMLVAEPRDIDALEEKVAHLLAHPEEAERMSERGRATVRPYSWESSSAMLERALSH